MYMGLIEQYNYFLNVKKVMYNSVTGHELGLLYHSVNHNHSYNILQHILMLQGR